MDVREWLAPDGFLSFYHKDHPRYGEPFSDTTDSTAIWLLCEKMCGTMGDDEINLILEKGIGNRFDGDVFLRYPGADTPMKRDQLDYFVPLLRLMGRDSLANHLVKKYGGTLLPHHKDHLYNEDTWLGRRADELDAWIDTFGDGSMPSLMNNIARYVYSAYMGEPRKRAVRIFKRRWDPHFVMVVYGARTPETEAGKKGDELVAIRKKVYAQAVKYGPGINTPPPIYQNWDILFRRYL